MPKRQGIKSLLTKKHLKLRHARTCSERGRTKGKCCMATDAQKTMCRRNRSYKHKGYDMVVMSLVRHY